MSKYVTAKVESYGLINEDGPDSKNGVDIHYAVFSNLDRMMRRAFELDRILITVLLTQSSATRPRVNPVGCVEHQI